jgi:putative flippase GtrA
MKLLLTRYFIVGGIAALIDISFFFIFAKLAGWNYLSIASAGFIIATFINYLLSIRWVFKSGIRFTKSQEILLVYCVSGVGLTLNLLVLYALVDCLEIELMLSKIIATASVFFWNFFIRRNFIFPQPVYKVKED